MGAKVDPADTLRRTRASAREVAERMGQTRLKKILKTAAVDLETRLRSTPGLQDGKAPFTLSRMQLTLAQVKDTTRGLNRGLKGTLLDQAKEAAETSASHLLDYMRESETKYSGIAQGLPLREVAVLDRAVVGARASVLRRIASGPEQTDEEGDRPESVRMGILERYGIETVEAFEEKLQLGLLTRASWGEIRDSITGESPFLQGAPAYWGERIVRTECLTGDTLVSGAMVGAIYRRPYHGDMVEIVTEGGRKFTATPNHPMLTRRGWVVSGELCEGDDLIRHTWEKNSSAAGDENEAKSPPTIAEVFRSLSSVGVHERRRSAKPDFHGDGADCDVDILRPVGLLKVGVFASVYKPLAEDLFTPSDFHRTSFCERCGALLSIQKQPCLCGGSPDSFLGETSPYKGLVDSETLSNSVGALSGRMSSFDFATRDIRSESRMDTPTGHPSVTSIGQRSNDSGVTANSPNATRMDSDFRANGIGAEAGDVEFDRILSVRVIQFDGHVYNLSTPFGYFEIDGVYTGNTMGAYNRAGAETISAANDVMGDMCKILSAVFDMRTGWDSYQVHGQIRRPEEPFEWAMGAYMHPPNRPNDREIVVPHRIAWPLPPYLEPKDDGEVIAAYHRQHKKGSPGERPNMSTVDRELFGK